MLWFALAILAGQGLGCFVGLRVIQSFGHYAESNVRIAASNLEIAAEIAEHTRTVDKARLYHMAVHDEQRRMWAELLRHGKIPPSLHAPYTKESA